MYEIIINLRIIKYNTVIENLIIEFIKSRLIS